MRVIKFSHCVALAASVFSLAFTACGETATNTFGFSGHETYPD